jgi:hypothetical protein
VPAHRRHAVDHRQGRIIRLPAEITATLGVDRSAYTSSHGVRRAGVRADSMRPRPRSRSGASSNCPPPRSTRKNWRAKPSARS